ncbi:FkbM family methyltransferase [Pyrolobus fumarii]|nr:FkbM family methyltransferase [Pyrolobus fumarii]
MSSDSDRELLEYVEELTSLSSNCLSDDDVDKLIECSLSGEGVVEVKVDGLHVIMPCSDTPEAWANLLHVYCLRDYLRVDGFEPRPGWVVVDAGAYLGFYTLFAAKRVGSNGLVIAIEPLQRNRVFIEENVVLNGFMDRVRIDPRALWSSTERRVLAVSCYPATSSFYREYVERHGDVCSEKRVSTVTLPELLREHGLSRVDLLKVDVEGAEADILAVRGWEDVVQRLVIEVHPWVVNVDAVANLLESRGFSVRVVDIGSPSQVMLFAWRRHT